MLSYTAPGYFSLPRNIMCSKKWANPVTPFSTSSRLPVRTIDQYETKPSEGIGIITTLRPLASECRWTS